MSSLQSRTSLGGREFLMPNTEEEEEFAHQICRNCAYGSLNFVLFHCARDGLLRAGEETCWAWAEKMDSLLDWDSSEDS